MKCSRDTALPCPYRDRSGVYFINVESALAEGRRKKEETR